MSLTLISQVRWHTAQCVASPQWPGHKFIAQFAFVPLEVKLVHPSFVGRCRCC